MLIVSIIVTKNHAVPFANKLGLPMLLQPLLKIQEGAGISVENVKLLIFHSKIPEEAKRPLELQHRGSTYKAPTKGICITSSSVISSVHV